MPTLGSRRNSTCGLERYWQSVSDVGQSSIILLLLDRFAKLHAPKGVLHNKRARHKPGPEAFENERAPAERRPASDTTNCSPPNSVGSQTELGLAAVTVGFSPCPSHRLR
jgi:hypothetical protein